MNLFDGNTKSANPASDVFAIIFGFIWKKPQITQMLAHARAARRCRLTPTCFAAALELPGQNPLSLIMRISVFLPMIQGCGAATPTRSRPRWSYLASLCVNILKKVARIYPQAKACPACFCPLSSRRALGLFKSRRLMVQVSLRGFGDFC